VRARDHGIEIGLLRPGPLNAITDVPGLAVGHASHTPDHTGVTAVWPELGRDCWVSPYFAGAASVYGVGEYAGITQIEEWGLAESPVFLTGTPYVGHVYAGATEVLSARQPRIGRPDEDVIIPVVAECDPSWYCDVREGPAPDAALVAAALDGARPGPVEEGQVGAGIGMSGFGWAAGIGTASRRAGDYTVGVLLLVNFGDPERLCVDGHPVGRELAREDAPRVEGSCFCLVATDAPLLPSALTRLARRPFLGLGRTGSYASNSSGEVAIAFSTANREAVERDASEPVQQLRMLRNDALNDLFAGVVEATEEAVLNALFAGRDLHGATGRLLPAAPAERIATLVRRWRRD
jgi:D-aminopeptidase